MVSTLSWGRGCRLDETGEPDIWSPGLSNGHRLRWWAGPPNQKEIGEADRLSTITPHPAQDPHFLAQMSKKQGGNCWF